MRRVFLLVGFNNWGKTTLIYDLFGRKRFLYGVGYPLVPDVGCRFEVESHSNDDLTADRYEERILRRVNAAPLDARDLVSVLCPTMEDGNDAREILRSTAFAVFGEIHLLLMRYKWDLHAELCLDTVGAFFLGMGDPRITVHVINENPQLLLPPRKAERKRQAFEVLRKVLESA